MTTTTPIRMTIDLTDADLDLDPEAMEELTSHVVEEMIELVDNARLMRESDRPEHGKPALAGFILGVLQAEVNLQNAKAVLDFLGERFYGKTLILNPG
ncbi:MAG TPA: hypothetical protein DCY91_24930 [Cyanobacteria bacterium UBA11370]|nr:hypothetical protein [Cyanobacteria bacterium UBA11370]